MSTDGVRRTGAWADRQRELGAVTDEDSRVIDQLADNLWGALRSRLLSYAMLPAADFPKAPRAAELVVVLFGVDGLQFLKDAYPLQLSTMDTLVKRIDEDKLQKEIDELAGDEFLQAIRKVMPRYHAMVTAMLKRDGTPEQNLLEHVRAIQRAIVEYATKVCATVDDDEPDTVVVARDALRPITNVRDQAAPGRRAHVPGRVHVVPCPTYLRVDVDLFVYFAASQWSKNRLARRGCRLVERRSFR